jgi:hypothetical protein
VPILATQVHLDFWSWFCWRQLQEQAAHTPSRLPPKKFISESPSAAIILEELCIFVILQKGFIREFCVLFGGARIWQESGIHLSDHQRRIQRQSHSAGWSTEMWEILFQLKHILVMNSLHIGTAWPAPTHHSHQVSQLSQLLKI